MIKDWATGSLKRSGGGVRDSTGNRTSALGLTERFLCDHRIAATRGGEALSLSLRIYTRWKLDARGRAKIIKTSRG